MKSLDMVLMRQTLRKKEFNCSNSFEDKQANLPISVRVRKAPKTFRESYGFGESGSLRSQRNTRSPALGVPTPFTRAFHQRRRLLGIFNARSAPGRVAGRAGIIDGLHRLLLSGHKASDWQWRMCRQRLHGIHRGQQKTLRLEGSGFTKSKGNVNQELWEACWCIRGLMWVWKIDDRETEEQMPGILQRLAPAAHLHGHTQRPHGRPARQGPEKGGVGSSPNSLPWEGSTHHSLFWELLEVTAQSSTPTEHQCFKRTLTPLPNGHDERLYTKHACFNRRMTYILDRY